VNDSGKVIPMTAAPKLSQGDDLESQIAEISARRDKLVTEMRTKGLSQKMVKALRHLTDPHNSRALFEVANHGRKK